MSDLSEVFSNEPELTKAEEIDSHPVVAEQDAETTIYDFDFWVIRDHPPYMV